MSVCSPRLKASALCVRIACLFAFVLVASLGGAFGQAQAAGITLVQHVGKDAGTTTTSTLAFSGANTAGNFIAVVIRGGLSSSQVFTVKDSNANTYKQAVQLSSSGSAVTSAIYYAENIKAGANTITVTMTVSGPLRFDLLEYSGVAASNSLDVTASATGTSTSPNSGNTTTTGSGELLLGEVAIADTSAFTAGPGYTLRDFIPAEPNTKLITEDQIQAAAGTASASASMNPSSNWAALLAAFKPAAGVATPSIASLNPTSGPVGTSVTITGSNFGASQGTSTVSFNGVAATPTSWSATSIVVPVPSGATSGNVIVTVGGVPSNAVAFTVLISPSITNLSPTFAPLGTSVTITGANFGASQGTSSVTFNGTATTPTSWSATSIIAPVPSGATTGNVIVTVGGLASNGVLFSVAPRITSISPTSGPVGTSVTITGTSFGATQGASLVYFGSLTATPTSWGDTSIVVPVPAGATSGNVMVFANSIGSNQVLFAVTPTPSISILSQTSGPVGTSVQINGTNFGASQGTSTVTFNGTAATPTSWSATSIVAPVPNGATSGNIVVTVGGLASNGVPFTVLIPPSISILSPTSGLVGASVTITGANFGSSQGTSTVTFNGTAATPTSWSPTSIVVPVPNGATSGNVVVTVSGLASNGVFFTVLVPPSITSISPTSGPVSTSFIITGTNFGASQGSSTVTLNGTALFSVTSWSSTSISAFVPPGATTGNVVVTVSGLASNGVAFTVIPTPSIASLSPTSGPIGTSVTITGANFGASQGTSTVTFNGTAAAPTSWSAASIVVPVPNGGTSGNVIVTVGGLASNGVLFTVLAPPAISSLSPNVGSVGTSVTISGTNFGPTQGSSTVTFNGTLATPTSWNSTGILVTVPLGATTGNLVVTVNGFSSNGAPFTVNQISVSISPTTVTLGTGAQQIFPLTIQNDVLNNGVTWSLSGAGCSGTACGTIQPYGAAPGEIYNAPATAPNPSTVTLTATSVTDPTKSATATITLSQTTPNISGLSPASGPAGSTVSINGTNFGLSQGTSTVTFNGTAATPTNWSSSQIVVTVPSGATTGNVVVTVGGFASNGVPFTVIPAPNIISLNPTAAPVGASVPVTITGTNFGASQGTSTVTFNGTAATPTSWSPASIVVPVPSAATSGNVVVTVGGIASNGAFFTVTPPPTISSLTPTSAPVGNSVVITGTNFGSSQGTSTVTFNGLLATTTSWGNTSILAQVPMGATTGDVVVTVAGVASNGMAFTIRPNVTGLSPTSGPAGTPVTITGTNFGATQGTSTVTFNGTLATPTSWSDTSIIVPVPAGATTGNLIVTVSGFATNGVPFFLPPNITNVSPVSGPVGTAVTISGTDFGTTGTVTFNGTVAAPTSVSNTSIIVPVPSGATTGNIVVTLAGRASNGVNFTVTPAITSLSPTTGPVGTSVSITGTNFGASQGASTLMFNGTSTTPTSWSDTSITAPVPSGASTGNVVVTVGGQASNGVLFTVAPNITSLSPTSGPANIPVTITGTTFGNSQGNSTVTFNGVSAIALGWSNTSIQVNVPTGVTAGPANVVVTVAGSASNSLSFTVAPLITSLSPLSGPAGTAVTITGSGFGATQGASTVTFNGVAATPTSWGATSIVVPVPSGATNGNVVVTVNGISSGGVYFAPNPPNISSLNPTSGPAGTSVTITGTFFGATQGTSIVSFAGVNGTPTSWSDTSITVPVPAGAAIGNDLLWVAVHGVGSNTVIFTVPSPNPFISSLNPSSGPVGTSVTITGTNFGATQGTSTVTFNGIAATPTSWSATSIVVPVPTGASAGNVSITVNGLISNNWPFNVTPAVPTITSVNPTSGSLGTAVTITGTNFGASQGSSSVTFNGASGTPTSWSATNIVVPVPATATTGNVVVVASNGSSSVFSNGVPFTVVPSITSLSPTSGPVGQSVVINGGGFGPAQGASAVTFNGVSAIPTSWSPSTIVASVPSGADTGNVVVTVSGGASNSLTFTVIPSISGVSPASGPAGTSITIAGNGFGPTQGSSTLTFNGTPATPISWNDNSIVASVPSGASTGSVFVTVGGHTSNGVSFTVTPVTITSLSPTSGPVGTSVTITGTNLGGSQGTSIVTFNGVVATPTNWTASGITVPVPAGAASGNVVVTVGGIASNGVLFTVPTQPANIALVQHVGKDAGTTTTTTLAFTSANTAGNFIAVAIRGGLSNSQVFTVKDSNSNTYKQARQIGSSGSAVTSAIYYAENIKAGANTITVTMGVSGPLRIGILEYSGVATANSLDSTAAATTTSASPNTGNLTTTANGDLLLGVVATADSTTFTGGAGYTVRDFVPVPPNTKMITEDQILSTAGTASASATLNPSSNWGAILAAFKAASGTGGAGIPAGIVVTSGTPQSATVNTAFASQLQATVRDSFNNPVSGVTVTFTAPGSGATAVFSGGATTAVTNASGVATSAALTANTTAGSYTVTGSVSGVVATANFSLTNSAGAASSIAATAGTPQSATINNAFATQFQAAVKDSFNNPVSGVAVVFNAPLSGASGTFPGGLNTATTNAQGVATAQVFTANSFTGSYAVTASVNGVGTSANFSLTNVSAPPASITATGGTPQSATVNTAFTTTFQVTVKDASNNPVSNVTVTFTAPGSGASGTFAGGVNTATTNSSGIASSAVFTANAVAGSYTVTASVPGVASPANFSLTNLAGPAANIAASAGTPQSAVVNTTFVTQLQATVTDSLNNPVTGVIVTFAVPGSGASGTFSGSVNTATTNAQGVATAPAFTANASVGGPYTVTASAPGVAAQATFSLTNLSTVSNIALVQHRNIDASTPLTNSLAFANNTSAGNFIAVVIRGSASSSQVFTVSDSAGNTYHQAFSFGLTASLETFAVFYAENIHGGADKVTVTQSVLGTLRFAILEYSGVAASNSLDGTITAQGTSASPNSGNLTTTANGDLLLAAIITKGSQTYTASGSYNIEETVEAPPNTKIAVEDQLQSAAGSVSAGVSLSGSDIWGVGLAAFRSISGTVAPISVSVSPTSVSIPAGYGTQAFTGMANNDFLSRGVNWSLSGAGCGGSTCGTFSRVTTTSVLYTAPSNIPSPATVTLTATSIGDNTKSASATITVTQGVLTVIVSPKRAAVTLSSSPVQFTGNVYNDAQNLGVTWQVDGNNGGTAASGTISATGLYTPGTQPGQHTITAASNANASVSGSALMAVTDLAGVYTNHNDNARTGQNLKEYGLTTATVTPSTFGQLFSCPVDGVIFAQPLWVANLNFSGVTHNVVFVATEHDSVYAFDADSPNCVQLWQTNFLSSGVTTLTMADVNSNTDIVPEIGITSTPVIDPATNTLYVVPKTRETVGTVNGQACSSASPCYVHRLHALNLITGAEKFSGPVVISATNFSAQKHLQRPALLLANSTVYLAFGSHGDQCNYQGWLMGYNAATLAQTFATAVSNPASGCNQGAIWQSGGGPSADASGNVYVVTANGLYDGTSNFGDTVLKFNSTGSMPPLDWFTPFNQSTLAANDVDLGAAAVLILPDAVGSAAHPHLAITTGKDAVVYLLDQANMGKFNSSSDNDVQELVPVPPANTTLDDGGNYVGPAYWNGNIYLTGQNYPLMQFQIANGVIATPQFASSGNTFPPRGGAPVVSANGATGGIVWIVDYTGFQDNTPGILDAYDANNIGTLLFSSPASGAGAAGNGVKWSTPTVANSRVYVGGQFVFTVYGLLPN